MWIGAESGLYRRLPDGRVERYTTKDGLPGNAVQTLLEDKVGQLWVGENSTNCPGDCPPQ
ncbi:MAG TPA: two-component regulator propeller domain-containing protein [Blastocatellia bacterium]|nr:two-component regulator propeller domain-containing protein [Blastocatellia bacterium]